MHSLLLAKSVITLIGSKEIVHTKEINEPEERLKLIPFSKANFAENLTTHNYTRYKVERSKLFLYLLGFLGYEQDGSEIEGDKGYTAKTLWVEENYLSNSYFQDFSSYYSGCYQAYEKLTRRIHIFSEIITEDQLFTEIHKQIKNSINQNNFWDCYRGHIVVKPIANAFIGATILKPYKSSNHSQWERSYNCCHDYKVNMFGAEISIKALIFQEQDRAVSNCASNALWCAFFRTHEIFRTPIPSSNSITQSAGLGPEGNRIFPALGGLSNLQISRAVKNIGLDVELRSGFSYVAKPELSFTKKRSKRFMHAYLSMGIPILVGYYIPALQENHIVTCLGFKRAKTLRYEKLRKIQQNEPVVLFADLIESFYIHNDQIGPYTRMDYTWEMTKDEENQFNKEKESLNISKGQSHLEFAIRIKWNRITYGYGYLISNISLVPKNVKVSFEDIYASISEIDSSIISILKRKFSSRHSNAVFYWDIALMKSNHYKREASDISSKSEKKKIMYTQYPDIVWVAKLFKINLEDNISELMNLIYDPSDVPSGFCLLQVNFLNEKFEIEFRDCSKQFFEKIFPTHYDPNHVITESALLQFVQPEVLSENHNSIFQNPDGKGPSLLSLTTKKDF